MMELITFEESQLSFNEIDLLRQFLISRYDFSDNDVDFVLSSSLEDCRGILLIDILYNAYVKLGSMEEKNEEEIKLYNKILEILNYHIKTTNFRDKNSQFMKEFEYVLLHYDEPNLGYDNDTSKKSK